MNVIRPPLRERWSSAFRPSSLTSRANSFAGSCLACVPAKEVHRQRARVGPKALVDRAAGIEPIQEAINRLATAGVALPRIRFGAGDKYRGWFGPQTVDALRAFQRFAGIGVDAKIGDDTLRALDNALVSAGVGGLMPGAPAVQPKASRATTTKPAAVAPTPAGKFVRTLAKVFNRGNPKPEFLQELVAWGKTAPE